MLTSRLLNVWVSSRLTRSLALVHTGLVTFAYWNFDVELCAPRRTTSGLSINTRVRPRPSSAEATHRNHGRATRTPWHPRGPLWLGHLPGHLPGEVRRREIISQHLRAVLTSSQPQHAPVRLARQDSDHLEPDPRRDLVRLPQEESARSLSHCV